jgi:myo-inositol-1(or 4)-monophosphatase
MSQPRHLLEIAMEATRMARLLATTTPITSIRDKEDRDIVTNVDLAIEDAVGSFLARKTPDIGFLGEEGSVRPPHHMRWVLDPIDGTGNFVHGLPFYGTAVSLIDGGRTTHAVIDLPSSGDTYTAISGSSARLNGRVVKCGKATELGAAMIGISEFARGEGAKQKNQQMLRIADALSYEAQHVRIIGSAITTLAWVADGHLDAAIILSNKTWDTSAGVLIAQCAGAKARDIYGSPHTIDSDSVVVATPGIEAKLLALLQRATGNNLQ